MKDPFEYDEEDFEEEESFDEDDEIRMAILEAEANEVWKEEPGDEEDEARLQMNPLFGLFSAAGEMGFPEIPTDLEDEEEKANNEDSER